MKKEIYGRLRTVRVCFWMIMAMQFLCSIIVSEAISKLCSYAMAGKVRDVLLYSSLIFSFYLFFQIAMGVAEYKMNILRSKEEQTIKMSIYERINDNAKVFFSSANKGELRENLSDDFKNVIDLYSIVQPQIIGIMLSLVGYFIYMCNSSFLIAVIMVLMSSLQLLPTFVVKKYLQKNYDDTRNIEAKISDCLLEGIQGFKTIKLYQLHGWWRDRIEALNNEYKKVGKHSIYTGQIEKSMNATVENVLKYGLYGILGLLAIHNIVTLNDGIKAVVISSNFFGIVGGMVINISKQNVSRTAEKRLYKLEFNNPEIRKPLKNSDIFMKDLKIYRDDKCIVNFSGKKNLYKKGIHCLQGKNGSGKTTLLNAISGIYEKIDGEITVGGISPKETSSVNYPHDFLYLMQQDFSMSLTPIEFYDAVLVKDKKCTAIDVCKKFGISENKLNKSQISDLSGGERKKIYLSAAIAIQPSILLLDEPTNCLDEDSKKILFNMINSMDSTIILVTHDILNLKNEKIMKYEMEA